ncbi:UNKNOWN [Stylonychia lemnae]|uniref:O-acyltransferase WSD1 C-terminal domain-containing protein n=1 Tax=Stylonychia lemnae TaxID=5949 RepID=A0A077ZUU1_STYLE|nr:UNKNOWN [Stylonychia lemnae]|eukprot:CDW73075.1 UNKNOWN [Stylonychia lemnae]
MLMLQIITTLLKIYAFICLAGLTSWIIAIPLYFICDQVIQFSLWYAFGLQKVMEGSDTLELIQGNLMVILNIETDGQVDSLQSISEQFFRNSEDIPELRSRVVKFLNNIYLKEYKGEELQKYWAQAFVEVQDKIHTKNELLEFTNKISYKKIPNEKIQFILYLIKDYQPNSSAIIMYINHGIADGVASFNLLNCLQDKFQVDNQPLQNTKSSSQKLQELKNCLIFPYYALMTQPSTTQDTEVFDDKDKPPSFAICKDYDLQIIKNLSRKFQCTINDIICNVYLEAYAQYLQDNKLSIPKNYKCCIPINLREPMKSKKDLSLFNVQIPPEAFLIVPQYLEDLSNRDEEFELTLRKNKQIFDGLKKINYAWSIVMGARFLGFILPPYILSLVGPSFMQFSRRNISNICGPSKPYIIGGVQTKRMHFRGTFHGLIAAINILSHNGIFRISANMDRVDINAKQLIQKFEESLDYWIKKKL